MRERRETVKWLKKQVCVLIVFSKKHDCESWQRRRRRRSEGHLLQFVSHSPGTMIPSTTFLTADYRQTIHRSSTSDQLQKKHAAQHTWKIVVIRPTNPSSYCEIDCKPSNTFWFLITLLVTCPHFNNVSHDSFVDTQEDNMLFTNQEVLLRVFLPNAKCLRLI